MKRLIAIIIACTLMMVPMQAQAKSANRYATKTMAIKESANKNAKTIAKIKRNTRVKFVKSYKKWAKVEYKSNTGYVVKSELHATKSPKKYTGAYLRKAGRINWRGYAYTWYSQRVMPGRGLKIPGRHVDAQGFVCDKDDYIVIGSCVANKRKKIIMQTPFGKYGKCYDCGYVGSRHADVYVAW